MWIFSPPGHDLFLTFTVSPFFFFKEFNSLIRLNLIFAVVQYLPENPSVNPKINSGSCVYRGSEINELPKKPKKNMTSSLLKKTIVCLRVFVHVHVFVKNPP